MTNRFKSKRKLRRLTDAIRVEARERWRRYVYAQPAGTLIGWQTMDMFMASDFLDVNYEDEDDCLVVMAMCDGLRLAKAGFLIPERPLYSKKLELYGGSQLHDDWIRTDQVATATNRLPPISPARYQDWLKREYPERLRWSERLDKWEEEWAREAGETVRKKGYPFDVEWQRKGNAFNEWVVRKYPDEIRKRQARERYFSENFD